MPISVSGAGVKASNAGRLVDLVESLDGFNNPSTSNLPDAESRAISANTSTTGGVFKIFTVVSGVPTVAFDATVGRILISFPSGAARVVRMGGGNGSVKIPAWQRFADPLALPIPFLRPLRRYTLLCPQRTTVIGTAVQETGIATTNGGLTMLGAEPAYVWASDPAVSGGAWRARYRRITAGAIVEVATVAEIPTVNLWQELGIRYTEGPVPTIEWLLNGVPRAIISGDAVMCALTGVATPLAPFQGVNTPAGTTIQSAACRVIVEEIGS